jgi:hypothetical protein
LNGYCAGYKRRMPTIQDQIHQLVAGQRMQETVRSLHLLDAIARDTASFSHPNPSRPAAEMFVREGLLPHFGPAVTDVLIMPLVHYYWDHPVQ